MGSSEWQGQLRETGSTSTAPPALSRSTFPRQHQSKGLGRLQRDIHLIKINNYCEDTILQNQLSIVQKLHHFSKALHCFPHHPVGSGKHVSSLTRQSYPSTWVLIIKILRKLHLHFVNYAAKVVRTRRALSSTTINSR